MTDHTAEQLLKAIDITHLFPGMLPAGWYLVLFTEPRMDKAVRIDVCQPDGTVVGATWTAPDGTTGLRHAGTAARPREQYGTFPQALTHLVHLYG